MMLARRTTRHSSACAKDGSIDEEMEAREHQHQPARHSLQQELLDRHSRADASALLNSNISSCIRHSAAFAGKING